MKRSRIDAIIDEFLAFAGRCGFHLPPWATFSPAQWAATGPEADEVRACQLGWDVTDFGSGQFERMGLTLFNIRNGQPSPTGGGLTAPFEFAPGKDYCEKIMLVREGQVTPYHFHFSKMEDIINRSGGVLSIKLCNATGEHALDEKSEVSVQVDGFTRTFPPGGELLLSPGESVTLPPYLYHQFQAVPGRGWALVGEVSRVNDDARDNRFLQPLPRFPAIEDDAPARYGLCTEYPQGAK